MFTYGVSEASERSERSRFWDVTRATQKPPKTTKDGPRATQEPPKTT